MFPLFRPPHRIVMEQFRKSLLNESQKQRPDQQKRCFGCIHPTNQMLAEILACFGPGSWLHNSTVPQLDMLWQEFKSFHWKPVAIPTMEDFCEWLIASQDFVDQTTKPGHDPGNLDAEEQVDRLESIRRCLYVAGYLDALEGEPREMVAYD